MHIWYRLSTLFLDTNLNKSTKTRFMVRGSFMSYYISICVNRERKEGEPVCFCASECVPNTQICTCKHICLYASIHKIAKVKAGL